MNNIKFIKAANQTEIDKKLIVIHWTAGPIWQAINWFKMKKSKTSCHYLISINGEITQMVAEKDIAWHAGKSAYKNYPTTLEGVKWYSLNPCSIGIELEGPPSRVKGMHCWPDAQINACVALCKDIQTRHEKIKLIDHSSINKKKIDVKKGTGKPEDVFPWDEFVKMTGIQEA